ncbi:MAG: hypothetical protein KDE26_01550 [Bacteroidetes bacterium]|nr:hypothetical protein [Bacteroidota bacterium]MCB0841929.1 hypothetical protein [Bacteroidota bacterium]
MFNIIQLYPATFINLIDIFSSLEPPFDILWMYISVFLVSSVKFAVAVLVALGNPKFNWVEIVLTAGGGAIFGSYIFLYFGERISKWVRENFKRSKPMSFANRRRILKIWKRYGLAGVAFLAPVLSPMISVGIAVSFQEKPRKILFAMIISILAWTMFAATFREVLLSFMK